MLPSFENLIKTKLSEIHNYAANQLLKTDTVNMENVKQQVILDSDATSKILMINAHTASKTINGIYLPKVLHSLILLSMLV